MGTRHLICVFWKGKWYIAQYGQWDGYPEGQGVKIFRFLSVARNIDHLKVGLENHIYEPAAEEVDAIWAECEAWDENRRLQRLPYERNMHGLFQLYPSLSRELSAGILGMIARAGSAAEEDGSGPGIAESAQRTEEEDKTKKKIPVRLNLEFANDGLFCEWAYVVDLDKEMFEIYGGCEKKHDGHRFKDVGDADAEVPAFCCSFEFRELYLIKSNQEFLDMVMKASKGRIEPEAGESDEDQDNHKEDDEEDPAEGSAKGSP